MYLMGNNSWIQAFYAAWDCGCGAGLMPPEA